MNIKITRPKRSELNEIESFFRKTIKHTFKDDGIGGDFEGIEVEVKKEVNFVKEDLDTAGEEMHFLIAKDDSKIVGTIAYARSDKNDFLTKNVKIDYSNAYEFLAVFVDPDYQGKGIGNILLNSILIAMQNKGATDICFDGGYKKSQRIWMKKFGEPVHITKNAFGEGYDLMAWHKKMEDIEIIFKV